jgi:hypothetical protein
MAEQRARRAPRVLVEAEDRAEAFARLRILQKAGYDVAWCPGPSSSPFRHCPIVRGASCPLVDSADVVVSCLGVEHLATRQVLRSMDSSPSGPPVVMETTEEAASRWNETVGRHRVIAAPTTPFDLVTAVNEALGSR